MSIFNRGFKGLEQEEKRREEQKKHMSGMFRLYIKEGEAEVVFLTEDPVNFYEHNVKTKRNGKDYFENVTCTGSECELCKQGDRPSFKSAWLVVDLRENTYKNKDGVQVTDKETIRLYVVGTKVAGLIQRKANRYGLKDMRYIIERIGKDTATTYSLDKDGKQSYSEKEIEELLRYDDLKELYDGTEESLMDIIEHEILKNAPTNTVIDSDDDEEDDNEAILGVDDEPTPKKKASKVTPKKKFTVKKKK